MKKKYSTAIMLACLGLTKNTFRSHADLVQAFKKQQAKIQKAQASINKIFNN